jgi:hypothetical protein
MDTAAKLSTFLEWAMEQHAAAKTAHSEEPDGGHGTELRDFQRLVLAGMGVARGRLPLSALAWCRLPIYGSAELLFTPEEISRARTHCGAETNDLASGNDSTKASRSSKPDRSASRWTPQPS